MLTIYFVGRYPAAATKLATQKLSVSAALWQRPAHLFKGKVLPGSLAQTRIILMCGGNRDNQKC